MSGDRILDGQVLHHTIHHEILHLIMYHLAVTYLLKPIVKTVTAQTVVIFWNFQQFYVHNADLGAVEPCDLYTIR